MQSTHYNNIVTYRCEKCQHELSYKDVSTMYWRINMPCDICKTHKLHSFVGVKSTKHKALQQFLEVFMVFVLTVSLLFFYGAIPEIICVNLGWETSTCTSMKYIN